MIDSNTTQVMIQLLMGLVYAIPSLLFIIISIYYLLKMGSQIDGTLILIGNVIIFLSVIIGQIAFVQFAFYQKWEHTSYSYISTGISIFSFIGRVLFAVGIFLLIKKMIKQKNSNS
ncbi:hypothetical protein [uncultured Aquimarina sp.]|uniref:hypothetical protein n=1 Tax=uncultured Aquimarina sp. TaxID=575652 RepID=UPI0026196EEA|nr:hypothetical protein [uncultured Aquimarina sp.]